MLDAPGLPSGGGARAAKFILAGGRGVRSAYPLLNGALHHIATNKNYKNAKAWSKKFEPLFKKAGYTLEDAVNKVFVPGHKGPHPQSYHQEVFNRIVDATLGLKGKAYKTALDKTLSEIATEAQTAGSYINNLLTK
jgi:hypothetical protein